MGTKEEKKGDFVSEKILIIYPELYKLKFNFALRLMVKRNI